MPRVRKPPINCAARNAVWVYPRVAPPRFPGAPEVVETARSHQMPDLTSLRADGAPPARGRGRPPSPVTLRRVLKSKGWPK